VTAWPLRLHPNPRSRIAGSIVSVCVARLRNASRPRSNRRSLSRETWVTTSLKAIRGRSWRHFPCHKSRPCSTKATNSEQTKSPLAIILQCMARRALADPRVGKGCGDLGCGPGERLCAVSGGHRPSSPSRTRDGGSEVPSSATIPLLNESMEGQSGSGRGSTPKS
jgi:hypothetical protein